MSWYKLGGDSGPQTFKTRADLVRWFREHGISSETRKESYFEFQNPNNKRILGVYRNNKTNYTLATEDGHLYHLQKYSEYMDDSDDCLIWEVRLDWGNQPSQTVASMNFDGILALLGWRNGCNYFK